MNLPSLPTDRLYKVQAFGGLSLILACAYWIQAEGTALQKRRADHTEQTRLVVSEYRFLVEERKKAAASLARFSQVGDSLDAREREFERRLAAIDA
jgi:hypothetical protein